MKQSYLLKFITLFCVLIVQPKAQDVPFDAIGQQSVYVENKSDRLPWHSVITRIPGDYKRFFTSFGNEKQLLTLAKTILLTASFSTFDESSWKFAHNLRYENSFAKKSTNFFVESGDGKYHAATAGLFLCAGWLTGNDRAVKTGRDILESLAASGLLVQTFKRIAGRESPAAGIGNSGYWHVLPDPKKYQRRQTKYYAFPSGHITTTVSTLTVIVNNYPEYKWLKPASYLTVAGVGFSLMAKDMHWISDYPFAVLIGYSIGKIVSGNNQKEIGSERTVKLLPYVNKTGFGTQLYYEF